MQIKSEKKGINRLTYDDDGKVVVVYENDAAAISLPLGFKGVEGEKITVVGRHMFTQQPNGFPLLIGRYPDIIGVFHLSHNEVLLATQRHVGAEGGYLRCVNGELYAEKVELPNRRRPCGMARIEGRNLVVAYDHDHFVYARGKCLQMPPRKGTVKVASLNGRVAAVCCDHVVLLDDQFEIQRRYEWGITDELRDVKFSQDGLLLHVAYKHTLLTFDLD